MISKSAPGKRAAKHANDGGLINIDMSVFLLKEKGHNETNPSNPKIHTMTWKLVHSLRELLVQHSPTARNSLEMKFALLLLTTLFHKLGKEGEVDKKAWLDAVDREINPPRQGYAPIRLGTGDIIYQAILTSSWDATIAPPDMRSADTITHTVYDAISIMCRKLMEEHEKLEAQGVDLSLYDVEEKRVSQDSDEGAPSRPTESELTQKMVKETQKKKTMLKSPQERKNCRGRTWLNSERLALMKLCRNSPGLEWERLAETHNHKFRPECGNERSVPSLKLQYSSLTNKGSKTVDAVIAELEEQIKNEKKIDLMSLVMPKSKIKSWMKSADSDV